MAKTLEELVESYGTHNNEFGILKKVCESEKAQIKDSMKTQGITEKVAGGWKVSYSVRENETINEEQMLQILKKDWVARYGEDIPCPYIKTREYIDMDALEPVLYANEIPQSTLLELDACRNVTEVVTLRCTKAKKAKEEDE